MWQSGSFAYAHIDDCALLQMPYRGGQLSMLVILPDRVDGLKDLECDLNLTKLKRWSSQLTKQTKVDVSFPKFKFDSSLDLVGTLKKLGMPTVFSNAADLSGIDGNRDLKLDAVLHKAAVQVDEFGTVAAAATAAGVATLGAAEPTHSIPFVADHPFLFLIRDGKAGTILFMGRVSHPQ